MCPADADATLAQLERLIHDEDFAAVTTAIQRVRRIVPPGTSPSYDPAHLVEPAEIALHNALAATDMSTKDLATFVNAASGLPIEEFFDAVLVMAEDQQVRNARLGLLASIAAAAEEMLDWGSLKPAG
ncbi:hypothetical protein [Actinocrispum sp. NPDC049592]|uniref:hypothetical protein n=1 Tax=Actinocrispum sp. NPDC049592 TaxID=3154835 RepID=UPI00342AE43A